MNAVVAHVRESQKLRCKEKTLSFMLQLHRNVNFEAQTYNPYTC